VVDPIPSNAIDPTDRLRLEEALLQAGPDRGITVTVLRRSCTYPELRWRLSLLLAAIALLAGSLICPDASPLELLAAQAAGVAIAAGLLRCPAALRALLSEELMERRVDERAARAYAEQVADSPAGVLILVSLLERSVVIWAGGGGAEACDEELDEAVSEILRAIEEGRLTDGLIAAMGRCQRLRTAEQHASGALRRARASGLRLEDD